MLDLDLSIDDVPLAFLDVETTGLDPTYGDRVCEVAILRVQGEEVVDALQQLVNPQRPIGAGAYAVNGISDEMVRDAPTFGQIAAPVLALLTDAVLVGHNTPFDLGFLSMELARLGVGMPEIVALDTLRLAKQCYQLRSYALGRLAQALGITVSGQHHRAMIDVLQTRAVLQRIVDDLWRRGVRTVGDYLRAQGGAVTMPRVAVRDLPPVIQEALLSKQLIRLRYQAAGGEETERLVRPLYVTGQGAAISLVAHCFLRDSLRNFRLDRILEMDLVKPPEE